VRRAGGGQPDRFSRKRSWSLAVVVLLAIGMFPTAEARTLEEYLSSWQLVAADREELSDVLPGSDSVEPPLSALRLLVRLLDRLKAAPADWQQAWWEEAVQIPPVDLSKYRQESRPVRLVGQAVEVRQISLPNELALIAGRATLSLVRLKQAEAPEVWLVVSERPAGWPAAGQLDEQVASEALLVAGPATPGQGGATMLAVSLRLSWWPDTPLADAGMDYGLFASIVDGQPLGTAEAEAFYCCLAAGRTLIATSAMRPQPPADLVPLLDPAEAWFATHRGDQLVLEGTARRITRIPVGSDRWRAVIGQDHYWEIFLFVSTPLIEIAGKRQESFPVVCCCLELPAGLPTGDRITERLRLAGFGFKRYRYETRQQQPASAPVRESPLLLGGRPLWLPAAAPPQLPGWLRWLPGALVVFAVLLLLLRLRVGQSRRRVLVPLPDRIELPLPEKAEVPPLLAEKQEIETGPPVNP
jgi:hypothetical protein